MGDLALATEPSRRFVAKLNSLLDKNVTVRLSSGRTYKGKLAGFDANSLSMVLESAEDSEGKKWPLVMIGGNALTEVVLEEGSVFDAKEFAEFLVNQGNVGRHLIKVYEDVNVVEVGKIVRVTDSGVEGTGPMAQKVHTLYMEYLRSKGVKV
ncbi:MAG: Lsm family RNA-binding protein [Acidilobaceae archaeon]|nr:Lsm family RNA-binding protein [Acidilobaceae archaeon]MCX8165661.1 Lsm family RNA-binding protein [Acidilobaceae archaeon]MDW7974086.1 Lsm family RNA-binding protein [Sulfolobales archaeon]